MQSRSKIWQVLSARSDARMEVVAQIVGKSYDVFSAPVIQRAALPAALSVGNCISATLDISVLTEDAIPRGAEIVVRQRLTDGDQTSEWLDAGTFFISKRYEDPVTGLLTFQCYDAMRKASANCPLDGAFPMAMTECVSRIAEALGIQVDARTWTYIETGEEYFVPYPLGRTMRQVLGDIAGVHGGNWVITPKNMLRFIPLRTAAQNTADTVRVLGVLDKIDRGESQTITRIEMQSSSGESFAAGDDTGATVRVLENPCVTQAICDALLEKLGGLSYTPFTLSKAVYDPAAELGDFVLCSDGVQTVLDIETATLGSAFRGDLSSPAMAEAEEEYPEQSLSDRIASVASEVVRSAQDTIMKAESLIEKSANEITASVEATVTKVQNANNGLGIKWNYSSFSNANNGEAYLCARDPDTGVLSDGNGWVWFNGTRRTVAKGMVNPDRMCPFNTTIYIVLRLTSVEATTGTRYLVWYDDGWKNGGINAATDATVSDWTWVEATDTILASFVEPASEAAFVDFELYTPVRTVSDLTTGKTARAELSLKVGRDENNQIVSMINASADQIILKGKRFVLDADNCKIDENGNLTVTNGVFSGKIISNEGKIAGFDFSDDGFEYENAKEGVGFYLNKRNIWYQDTGSGNSNLVISPQQINIGTLTAVDVDLERTLIQKAYIILQHFTDRNTRVESIEIKPGEIKIGDLNGNQLLITPTNVSIPGGTVSGTMVFSKTTDASGTANNSPALIVGGTAMEAHLEFDANEIMAKGSGTTTAALYINQDGGTVYIGSGGLRVNGPTYFANGTTYYVSASGQGHFYGAYFGSGEDYYFSYAGNVVCNNLTTSGTTTLGGNLTINEDNHLYIRRSYGSGVRQDEPLRLYACDANGSALVMQAGGLTIVGGGEAGTNLYNALTAAGTTAGTEQLHLAADGAIYLHTNCNTIADRVTISIGTDGKITTPGGLNVAGNVTAPKFIQAGAVSITPAAANTPTSVDVKFPTAFPGAPRVVATAQTSVPGTTVTGVGVTNISATGCTLWMTRTNTTAASVHWVAVYS